MSDTGYTNLADAKEAARDRFEQNNYAAIAIFQNCVQLK